MHQAQTQKASPDDSEWRTARWRDGVMGGITFAAALFVQITGSFASQDEAWFVQVARRVVDGEVLYRDVAFGLNPLSMYLCLIPTWAFGAEILTIKVLQAAIFAATAVVIVRLIRRFGVDDPFAELAAVLAFFLCAPAGITISMYTPLSMLLLLLALAEALAFVDGEPAHRVPRIVCAGLWTGAAFAAKQNVGVLAGLALAGSILVVGSPPFQASMSSRFRDLARAFIAAAAVVVVMLAPIFATGAFPAFLDYAYLGKTTYVQVAGVDPFATVRDWAHGFAATGTLAGLRSFLSQQAALLPVLAFAGLATLAPRWWMSDRARTVVLLFFAVAGFASAFPRADLAHVAGSAPVLIVAVAHAVWLLRPSLDSRAARAIGAVALILVAVGTGSQLAAAVARLASPEHRLSRMAGATGIIAPNAYLDDIARDASGLDRMLAGRDAVFLLSPRAGLFSILGNRHNPTPFDYPFVTTLGSAGEDGLVAMLDSGRIQFVCIDESGQEGGTLWPARFEAEVRRRFVRLDSSGRWALYGPS